MRMKATLLSEILEGELGDSFTHPCSPAKVDLHRRHRYSVILLMNEVFVALS